MRKSILVLLFGVAATAAAQDSKPPAATQELDKDTQTRIRTERSAGGLGKITPEEKEGANVGAGPHKQFKPEGAARRDPGEDASEQSARGATRGEGLESKDARPDARRP